MYISSDSCVHFRIYNNVLLMNALLRLKLLFEEQVVSKNTFNGTRSRLLKLAILLFMLNSGLMSLANPQVLVGYDTIAIRVILNVLFQLVSAELVCTGILQVKHVPLTCVYKFFSFLIKQLEEHPSGRKRSLNLLWLIYIVIFLLDNTLQG